MATERTRLAEIYMRVIDPKKIQKLLLIQGVTHRELALAVGYKSHAYIGRIVRGDITTVTPEKAARIANYFSVGIDDLFVPRLSTDAGRNAKRGTAA